MVPARSSTMARRKRGEARGVSEEGRWGVRDRAGCVRKKLGVGQAAGREQVRIIGRYLAHRQRQNLEVPAATGQAAKAACEQQTLFSRATPSPRMLHPARLATSHPPSLHARLLQPVSCFLRRVGLKTPAALAHGAAGPRRRPPPLLHPSTLLLFHISFLLLSSSPLAVL